MAKIVAFSVPSITDGEKALDELEHVDDVDDVALVTKNDEGKVRIRQTSDVTAGKGAVRGALLGAALSIVTGPLGAMALAGAAGGSAFAVLRDKGIDDKLMKLLGEELDPGAAAVFVMAEDVTADRIVSELRQLANLKQYADTIDVIDFPAEAQKAIRDSIKTEHEALVA